MDSNKFAFNIAVIGHVSVGKSTLLNAILGAKFSEVSKRRTTAGINHFHLSCNINPDQTKNEESKCGDIPQEDDSDKELKVEAIDDINDNIKTQSQTLAEITQDNAELRQLKIIRNKHFHISVDEMPFEIHRNASLTFIDIPGLNEAGTQDIYTRYVTESWYTYSCILLVMDVSQGVSTEEQVELLKFVELNVRTKKNIPVIVVCNKVDDVEDEELMELVNEVQAEVNKIFKKKSNFDDITKNPNADSKEKISIVESSPAFIHMSAENAFMYRSMSSLTLEDFSNKVEQSNVDMVGKAEFGNKWRKMTMEQKYKAIHDLANDPEECKDRLVMTNYDKLISLLGYFLGGDENLLYLVGQQVDTDLARLSKEGGFAKQLSLVHDSCKLAGKDTSILLDRFWPLFVDCKSHYMAMLEDNPEAVDKIHIPMQELCAYHDGMLKKISDARSDNGSIRSNENKRVMKEMKNMVNDYIKLIESKISRQWNFLTFYDPYFKCCDTFQHYTKGNSFSAVHPKPNDFIDCWEWNVGKGMWRNKHTREDKKGFPNVNPAVPSLKGWYNMNEKSRRNILNSVLLMNYERNFCENFGNLILDLLWQRDKDNIMKDSDSSWQKKCCHCNQAYTKSSKYHRRAFMVVSAGHPSDPKHYGHLIWLFCRFYDSFHSK